MAYIFFDVDGTFQVVLLAADGLDSMDTVERKKLGYRMQINVENLTHNGNFFYYDGNFVIVVNDVTKKQLDEIVSSILKDKALVTTLAVSSLNVFTKEIPSAPSSSHTLAIPTISSSLERTKGFLEVLEEYESTYDIHDFDLVEPDAEFIYQYLKNNPQVDGIFAMSDTLALIALGCLQKLGRKVPDEVQLVGFGTFEVRQRAARKGRNPQTKEEIKIPASKAPVFKAGKALKDLVNKK